MKIAWKDITRKKNRSLLYILTLCLVDATGISLFLISSALKSQIMQVSGRFNGVILRIMIEYLNFLIIFTFLASIVVASVLASLLTISRMKDLAIFQSIGGTYKQIQRIPIAEIFIITLIACFLGLFLGVFGGYLLIIVLGLDNFTINIVTFGIFVLQFILLSVIGTYFTSGFFVNYLLRKKFSEILNSQYEVGSGSPKTAWGFSTKGRTAFKFGHLFQQRAPMISRIMIFGILILTLIGNFGILGGSIIQETTDSYIERGYGAEKNTTTIVVTPTSDSLATLQLLYDSSLNLDFSGSEDLAKHFFTNEFLSQIPQNTIYESRLLVLGTIHLIVNLGEINNTDINIGNNTFQTYFWGVDTSFGNVFNYYSVGKETDFPNNEELFIGDGYHLEMKEKRASKLFPKSIDNNSIEDLQRFDIAKMLIDPFAHGFCTYVNLNTLNSLTNSKLNNAMRNVIFFQNPDQGIFDLLTEFDLDYFSLYSYNKHYLSFSQQYWLLSNIALIPVIFAIGLSLVAFSNLYAIIIKKDLYIMRVLGGKDQVLKRILLWINFFVSFQGMIPGFVLGFSLAYSVLTPEPALPTLLSWLILIISSFFIGLMIERYLTRFSRHMIQNS